MYTTKAVLLVLPALGALASPFQPHEKREDTGGSGSAPETSNIKWPADGSQNPGGNIQVGWANSGVLFGSQKPSDIIRNNVSSTCATIGTCINGNDVSVPSSSLIDGGQVATLDISYTVDGDYPTWVHNGLIEMLAFVMDNQTTVQNNVCGLYNDGAVCAGTTGGDFCPETKECYDQYTAPGSVAVVLAGDNVDPNAAPGYISVQFTTKEEGSDGNLCDTMTTLGSGLAGFIADESAGPVGGIFTLASLFCDM
ncbi:MAG: hypothetical protein Q9162_006171 [Coniocarpon cinnabarinum]